ncbi:hypothetical protein RJT34_14815 [Clitoria ternatea]|uniref:Protein kinase domain-containing protein n=1 Tax=Clitoria ternatea TaxID=43366 RepID=A0AAN9JRF8_CLITE
MPESLVTASLRWDSLRSVVPPLSHSKPLVSLVFIPQQHFTSVLASVPPGSCHRRRVRVCVCAVVFVAAALSSYHCSSSFSFKICYRYLFHENKTDLGFEKLHEIAIGTARGIAYLHEECQQRIIHYDIKPGNILLDRNFNPKVADFGLAKLSNRENTHITMTGGRGTPGYAAPELWMPFPVTHKCDVYSFGMLLFEIIGRRRNHDSKLAESQEWFPIWVWKKFDTRQLGELIVGCEIEEQYKDIAERMLKIALWCVQYRPESRPIMSVVVKMLEGSVEIPEPMNPFQHMMGGIVVAHTIQVTETYTRSVSSGSSAMVTDTSIVCATPLMRKYGIELVTSKG